MIFESVSNRRCITFGLILLAPITYLMPLILLHSKNHQPTKCDCVPINSKLNNSKFITEYVKIVIWESSAESRSHRQTTEEDIAKNMNNATCFEGCSILVSSKQEDVDSADSVLFFMFREGFSQEELPRRASPHQIWVYHQREPPTHFSPGIHLNNLFNWTLTYRRDSDIFMPYFITIRKKPEVNNNDDKMKLRKLIKKKNALGTAVISNCRTDSKRENILESLKKTGIQVDIYGKCGNNSILCTRWAGKACNFQFWSGIAKRYKFYFAIENSLCSDYVTEKLWRSLQNGMVPVVLGRINYSEIAPPYSFIDIRDFSNPKQLASYLLWLDENSEEYAKYFEWRKKYFIGNGGYNLCELCGRLRERKKFRRFFGHPMISSKYSIPKLKEWWLEKPGGGGNACISPEEMGINQKFTGENGF